jgi:tRNA pseudouridine55 synthase
MLNTLRPSDPWPNELPKGFVLLIDKPLGWTSFDVVNKVRWHLNKYLGVKRVKIGHAGTLDPLATGLLILCVGEYTRRIEEFQGQEKAYTGSMTFGAVTASFDLEKPIEPVQSPVQLDDAQLESARQQLVGAIEQYPPIFSAVKVDGKRMYEAARKGNDVELKPRKVWIGEFKCSPLHPIAPEAIRTAVVDVSGKGHPLWYHPDYAEGLQSEFEIVCGKGTYIRSMACDMGNLCGCGAYLSSLRRTRIGEFLVDHAWEVGKLIEHLAVPQTT